MSQSTPPPYEPADGHRPYDQPQGGATAYGSGPGAQGYPQAPQHDSYGGYTGTPTRGTNSMALVSLISGIAGLTVLFFIGSIIAVITGYMARRQLAETGEEGEGMAKAGLIMGWVGIALGILIVVGSIVLFGGFLAAIGSAGYAG